MDRRIDFLTHKRSRFLHLWLPGLLVLLYSVAVQVWDLDMSVAGFFYTQAGWLGQDNWWIDTVIHDWGRAIVVSALLASLLVWLVSFITKRPSRHAQRRASAYLMLCITLTTGTVALGKTSTNVDCPWDIDRFGGDRPYIHVFSDKPATLPRGGCFPGGHSSGAFSLIAGYFILRRKRRGHARLILGLVLLLGLVFAYGQWARGAHFPLHDLWSAGIAWYIGLGLYLWIWRRKTENSESSLKSE